MGFSKRESFAVGMNDAFQAFTSVSFLSLRAAPQVRDQDIPVKRNLVRVIVNVDDTNDNAPWFVGTSFAGRVFESAAVGSAVLQVTARDKDKGRNAEIVYSLESGKFTLPLLISLSRKLSLSNITSDDIIKMSHLDLSTHCILTMNGILYKEWETIEDFVLRESPEDVGARSEFPMMLFF